MKYKLLSSLIAATIFTGCATNDYTVYAETQKAIAQARAISDTAKYNALLEIAKTGDSAAKVAAVISINMLPQSQNQAQQVVAAPKSFGDIALQWTSLLLPNLTQIYGITKNADVSIVQSNNAALVARSTNDAFVGISGKIQAPQANVITTTNNTTTTTSTSTIGGNNNTGSNSGNSGRVSGGDLTDNTSTPVVVKPEVVNTSTTNTTTNTTNSNNTTTGTGGGG